MKLEIPIPAIIGAVVLVLAIAGFLLFKLSTPTRPADARPAAEGIRADLAKRLGLPKSYLHNPKKD